MNKNGIEPFSIGNSDDPVLGTPSGQYVRQTQPIKHSSVEEQMAIPNIETV